MNTKQELKEIIDNNNVKSLIEYIKSGAKLDYSFTIKEFGSSITFNPFIYAGYKRRNNILDYFLEKLDKTQLQNLCKSNGYQKVEFLFNPNEPELMKKIYGVLDGYGKMFFGNSFLKMGLDFVSQNELENFVPKTGVFKKLVEADNGYEIMKFLENNKDFDLFDKEINYLQLAIDNHAVYCFDIIKDEMKNIKKENNLNKAKKVRP